MQPSPKDFYTDVMSANITLHTKLADTYNSDEPHFRPENIQKVEAKITKLVVETNAKKLLDLGCGTGFVINIAKKHVAEIHGVDATRAMLDKVDTAGGARVELHEADTATVDLGKDTFDLVTAYSFLHHLYDIKPTLRTAYNSLRKGGKFYCDLEPNYYFWEDICTLDKMQTYHPIVQREILMVADMDQEIERKYGVEPDVYNLAEYGKSYALGFKEEIVCEVLKAIGFSQVEFFYDWFVGQGAVINDVAIEKEQRFLNADVIANLLQDALPLSRNLFKYVGFIATK